MVFMIGENNGFINVCDNCVNKMDIFKYYINDDAQWSKNIIICTNINIIKIKRIQIFCFYNKLIMKCALGIKKLIF